MKPLLVLTFLLLVGTSYAQGGVTKLDWLTNLEEAEKISKEENKPILVYFTGSDWCSPCKMLKEDFFHSPEFESRADKMVLVMIDLPRRIDILTKEQLAYNKKIIARYNKEKTFPKLLILNSSGKQKGRLSGYSSLRDTSNHFAFVDHHLENYR